MPDTDLPLRVQVDRCCYYYDDDDGGDYYYCCYCCCCCCYYYYYYYYYYYHYHQVIRTFGLGPDRVEKLPDVDLQCS